MRATQPARSLKVWAKCLTHNVPLSKKSRANRRIGTAVALAALGLDVMPVTNRVGDRVNHHPSTTHPDPLTPEEYCVAVAVGRFADFQVGDTFAQIVETIVARVHAHNPDADLDAGRILETASTIWAANLSAIFHLAHELSTTGGPMSGTYIRARARLNLDQEHGICFPEGDTDVA